MKALETHYGGCRFRSRLEARWAVFFDKVGIAWEYEPQGFLCSYRLTLAEGSFPYLPDFWLPGFGVWAEVKGALDKPEMWRLLDAAASLSSNDGGGCHDSGGHDLVVLGGIPRTPLGWAPVRLHMHKGDLTASPWLVRPESCVGRIHSTIASDCGSLAPRFTADAVASLLLNGTATEGWDLLHVFALQAARSARFEHGERP